MLRTLVRTSLILSTLGLLQLAGPVAEDAAPATGLDENGIAHARQVLTDLLVGESIDRIDFVAETYEQGMSHIHITVDAVLKLTAEDVDDADVLIGRVSEVIEALNEHARRGLAITFGPEAKNLAVRDPLDAGMLGRVIGESVALIHDQLGDGAVSYREHATKLFRSVVLDTEEGELLPQYAEGVERVVGLPRGQRSRYLQ